MMFETRQEKRETRDQHESQKGNAKVRADDGTNVMNENEKDA
jgi:hypothetical protein